MVYEIIKCPYCQSEHIVRYGKSKSGKQKYKCCNENCHKIFGSVPKNLNRRVGCDIVKKR